jgi:hypothetical protein
MSISDYIIQLWDLNLSNEKVLVGLIYSFNATWAIILFCFIIILYDIWKKYQEIWISNVLLSIPYVLYAFIFAWSIWVTITMLLLPGIAILLNNMVNIWTKKWSHTILFLFTILSVLIHPSFIALLGLLYIFYIFRLIIIIKFKKSWLIRILKLCATWILWILSWILVYFIFYSVFLIWFIDEFKRKNIEANLDTSFLNTTIIDKKWYIEENIEILILNHDLWILLIIIWIIWSIVNLRSNYRKQNNIIILSLLFSIWIILSVRIVPPLKPFEYSYWLILIWIVFLQKRIRNFKREIMVLFLSISLIIIVPDRLLYWASKSYIKQENYTDSLKIANTINYNLKDTGSILIMWIWPTWYIINSLLNKNISCLFWEKKYPDIPIYNELSLVFSSDNESVINSLIQKYKIKYIVMDKKQLTQSTISNMHQMRMDLSFWNLIILKYENSWN